MALPKKIRSETCPNCGQNLVDEYNFCPRCGQENHHPTPGLKTILSEFIGEAGGIDSQFLKTLKELLFKPGALTLHYLANRKAGFVLPSKLYLFFSFVFFLCFTFSAGQFGDLQFSKNKNGKVDPSTSIVLGDSLHISAEGVDSLLQYPKHLNEKIDSILTSKQEKNVSWIEKKIAKTLVLFAGGLITWQDILGKFIQNLSLAMFFLMPFFAFLLSLFYFRSRLKYSEHLIFSIHFHSFVFFIFTIWLLFLLFTSNFWVNLVFLFFITLYFIKGLRYVYSQSWKKTMAKAFLIILVYTFVLLSIVAFTLIISIISL